MQSAVGSNNTLLDTCSAKLLNTVLRFSDVVMLTSRVAGSRTRGNNKTSFVLQNLAVSKTLQSRVRKPCFPKRFQKNHLLLHEE